MNDISRGEEPQLNIPETTGAAPGPEVGAPVAAPTPEVAAPVAAPTPEAAMPAPAAVPMAGAPAVPGTPAPLPPAAYGATPPPRKGLGTGAILGIVGAGLFVLIALIVAIVVAVGAMRGVAGGAGAGGDPKEAAEGYLAAISDGDAEAALSYLDETVSSGPLLTDEALAAAQELAPLTDIVIGEPDVADGYGHVPVSYSLGDTPVSTELSVFAGSGGWRISGGTGQLSVYQLDGLDPMINGVPVSGEYVDVLPGAYEYSVGVDGFALEGETTLLMTAPHEYPDTSGMSVVLTPEATDAFRQAVSASVDACVASTTLDAGCGLAIPATLSDGTQLTEGTLTRSLPAETRAAIGAMEPDVSYDVPTLVSGGYLGSIEVTAECTKDGATGTCSVLFGPSLGTPSMNFADEGAVVEWD